ncbi:hypothetical protein [Flavobacterium tructae]|nr:hypothetical protein [Flavobacterium tructae]
MIYFVATEFIPLNMINCESESSIGTEYLAGYKNKKIPRSNFLGFGII